MALVLSFQCLLSPRGAVLTSAGGALSPPASAAIERIPLLMMLLILVLLMMLVWWRCVVIQVDNLSPYRRYGWRTGHCG